MNAKQRQKRAVEEPPAERCSGYLLLVPDDPLSFVSQFLNHSNCLRPLCSHCEQAVRQASSPSCSSARGSTRLLANRGSATSLAGVPGLEECRLLDGEFHSDPAAELRSEEVDTAETEAEVDATEKDPTLGLSSLHNLCVETGVNGSKLPKCRVLQPAS